MSEVGWGGVTLMFNLVSLSFSFHLVPVKLL